MKKYLQDFSVLFFFTLILLIFLFPSCSKEDNTLAPYAGSSGMSNVTIQDSSFTPKINWVGGYVSVVGINRGEHAALDTSLIWLIYNSNDQIHYPVQYGVLPAGAQDLTDQYNGTFIDSLVEDNTYTFWVMRAEDWDQISSMQNKIIILDSSITSLQIDADTIRISPSGHTQKTQNLDIYVNIFNIETRGKLGSVLITPTNRSNNPIISWDITQVSDSLISAIGITEGSQYNGSAIVWEVFSVSDSAGVTYYGKKNIIAAPVTAGQDIPGTYVFTPYLQGGLKRNTSYNVWIANKYWDGEGRTRVTDYYAYASFDTN